VISYSVGQFVPFKKLSKAGTIAIALLCLLILPIINIYIFWRIYDEFNIQNHLGYLGLNIIIGILLGVMLHRIAKKEKAIPPMNQINPRIRAILYIVFSFWIGAIILMIIMGVYYSGSLDSFSLVVSIAGIYTVLGAILALSIPFTNYTKSENFKIGWIITIIAWLLPLVLIYIVGLPIDEKTTLAIYTCISFFPALISGFYLAKKLQKLGKTP
jgi:putative membrane protein